MNRKIKNIIIISIMLLALIAIPITGYIAKENLTAKDSTKVSTNNGTKDNSDVGNEPELPEEENGKAEEPPALPEEEEETSPDSTEEANNNDEKAPSMGSDALDESTNSSSSKKRSTTTDEGATESTTTKKNKKPSSDKTTDSSTNTEKKERPAKPENSEESLTNINNTVVTKTKKVTTGYLFAFTIESLIFSLCLMYLILSKMNEKTFQDTLCNMDKIMIYILGTMIITSLLIIGSTRITNNILTTTNDNIIIEDRTHQKEEKTNTSIEENNKETTGSTSVIDDKEISGEHTSTNSDESAILINNGGNANINNATVTKSGDTTNTENSDFYGTNAAILVQKDSQATIKNTSITTSAKGGNAIFATGDNSKIYISDSTINSTGSSSARGLDATYGGYIEADNVNITTQGGSSAALATDRGEGTIKVNNSKLSTKGKGSPLIYSTGDISIDNTTGVANNAQMVVVEGKNTATINNSQLVATGIGNRNNVDKAGIMIYQSMSGDAKEGKGTFNSVNSILTISDKSEVFKTAPMFFVTNTNAEINLTNTKLSYGSNILLSIAGTNEWGKINSNGGNVELNTNNQTMTGRIIIDNISSLTMNLTKTSYKGSINATDTAKEVVLKMDKDSKITLTADSYVTSLDNEDNSNSNIELNDHHLYVNGKEITQR